jgi:hypothetical protein
MMRTTALVLASLAFAIHGREIESEQMQQLVMQLLMVNPARAHSSAVRRSSMVMQAGLSNKEKTKRLYKEMLEDELRAKNAATGPVLRSKFKERAGPLSEQIKYVKDYYPYSKAGFICSKLDAMREYWVNEGARQPRSLKELGQVKYSAILNEEGTLKTPDADEKEMRKECDAVLPDGVKTQDSKLLGLFSRLNGLLGPTSLNGLLVTNTKPNYLVQAPSIVSAEELAALGDSFNNDGSDMSKYTVFVKA